MTSLLQWLLDLQSIRLAEDAPLLLQWDRKAPAWLIFAIALSGLAFIAMVYRRERTTGSRRTVLAIVRSAVLLLVLAIFCKPSLVLQRNRIEPSFVALLVDSSASMAATDVYTSDDPPGLARRLADAAGLDAAAEVESRPRLHLVQSALTRNDGAAVRKLLEVNGVQLAAFSGAVEPVAFADSANSADVLTDAVRTLSAEGFVTDVAGAIQRVLETSEGRRLAAIILATDGRSTRDGSLREALDVAAGRQVPIYPVRIGSGVSPVDIEVGPLRAPQAVFLHDILAIEAQVGVLGDLAEPLSLAIRLIELAPGSEEGEVVATEHLHVDSESTSATAVELRTKPERTGLMRYRVECTAAPNERLLINNADHVDVTVTDDRLRVLYVEGYPRYEYRYLKNALLRERSMDVSVLLIEADEQFVQEGTAPLRRFPDTPEELNRFDVVLFGDVDPRAGWLTQSQMLMLLDFVANEGGGFAVISGERSTPHRFLGTPLERLVPVVLDPSVSHREPSHALTGFRAKLTPEGYSSRPFRFAPTPEENRRAIEALPELFWFARTLGAKPGAMALAEHPTVPNPRGAGGMPLVVMGQYGAGKLYFQATDDTWRWRRHTGELLHDSYWVQVARTLMRPTRVTQADHKYVLRADRRSYPYGTPVHLQAEVFDPQLLRDHPVALPVGMFRILGAGGEQAGGPRTVPPSLRNLIAEVSLTRLSSESNLFEGSWIPSGPGNFDVSPVPSRFRSAEVDGRGALSFRVENPDLETRRPAADATAMETIATVTGGRVLQLDELEEGFATIRDRRLQVPDDLIEPLWDSKLALMLFTGLLALEWVLRKSSGLL